MNTVRFFALSLSPPFFGTTGCFLERKVAVHEKSVFVEFPSLAQASRCELIRACFQRTSFVLLYCRTCPHECSYTYEDMLHNQIPANVNYSVSCWETLLLILVDWDSSHLFGWINPKLIWLHLAETFWLIHHVPATKGLRPATSDSFFRPMQLISPCMAMSW